MADLSELVVKIKADTKGLDAEMKKATNTVKGSFNEMSEAARAFSSVVAAAIPVVLITKFVGFAKNASLAADRLNDLAARSGVAATTLSALELPLQLSGSSAEQFSSALVRMNDAIGEAANGANSQVARVFNDLGLSISYLMSLSPDEQFNAIARSLNAIDNQAEFTNKGIEIFGRQFANIAPVIREANGEISEFIKKQQELGNAFTAEELQMVNNFWDNWDAGIKRAEIATIRFINLIANLRSKISAELDFTMIRLPNGKFVKVSNEDVRSRTSSVRPQTVDEATFISKPQSLASASARVTATASAAKAQEDYNTHLDLYKQAAQQAAKETEQFTNTLKDRLSKGLTDAAFDARSAGDAIKRMGDEIARSIFERSVAQPVSGAIIKGVDSLGIGSLLGGLLPSFDVGTPYVPQDMVAMIHKGERVVPANQNNPSGLSSMGGGAVTVNQYFQTGVTRTELQAILPQVAAAAKNAVFDDIQRGGSAAKIVGAR